MRILITGASGAVGVHCVSHIMENTDWEVIALDSFRAIHKGYFDRLAMICDERPEWGERIDVICHDLNAPITDREIEKIGDVNYILNLASRSDVQASIDDPKPFVRNNVNLMLNILEYATKVDIDAFLQFSTDEVYGPTTKDSDGHPEWSTMLPSNPYSASKASQEMLAIAWWRAYGVPVIITNTMNNFGEMQAPSKFPAMIQQYVEKGKTLKIHATENGEVGTRYYLHSRNAADAVLYILQNIEPKVHEPGEIDKPLKFNIVGDKQISNKELVDLIAGLMGKEAKTELSYFHEDNPGHDLHYGLDGTKLEEAGWEAPLTLEESMKNTIEWQQNHPKWMK